MKHSSTNLLTMKKWHILELLLLNNFHKDFRKCKRITLQCISTQTHNKRQGRAVHEPATISIKRRKWWQVGQLLHDSQSVTQKSCDRHWSRINQSQEKEEAMDWTNLAKVLVWCCLTKNPLVEAKREIKQNQEVQSPYCAESCQNLGYL